MATDLQLTVEPKTGKNLHFPFFIRVAAHFFSVLFHPLFISSYVFAFLIFIHPSAYAGIEHQVKIFRMLHIVLFNAFFPGFSVFLAWRLAFLKSIRLPTVRDRIIPYVLTMFFYFWTWNVFRNLSDSPPVAIRFTLGSFLAICAGWMWNIYFKVSMHALAAGGLMMFFILFSFADPFSSGVYIAVAFLVVGIILTSRFIVSDHSQAEIYTGLAMGLLAQWIAWQF